MIDRHPNPRGLGMTQLMKLALLTTLLKKLIDVVLMTSRIVKTHCGVTLLIRHDCVKHKRLGDGHKSWGLLQERFRSNETVTVVNVMRQLARLTLKKYEALHNYFIRAQIARNKRGNTYHSHCSMQWYPMAYLSGMSTSWCKRASIQLVATWSFEHG